MKSDALYAELYGQLKRLAGAHLSRVGPITLDPASLVHEAWLRSSGTSRTAASREQFFAHASRVMRSVVVDHLRARQAEKRGGGQMAVTLSSAELLQAGPAPEVLLVDEALQALAQQDERLHQVVEMRYFGGMQLAEIALALELSVPTVERAWQRARAYLYEQLKP
jgi:RNA polymerase sigma factor (TIGR02999 family)